MTGQRWHGKFFEELELFLRNVVRFFDRNEGFTEFFFIVLYAIEQLAILLIVPRMTGQIELFVGLAVLMVLTTITLDKLYLRRKLKQKNEELINLENTSIYERENLETRMNELVEEYNELLDIFNDLTAEKNQSLVKKNVRKSKE